MNFTGHLSVALSHHLYCRHYSSGTKSNIIEKLAFGSVLPAIITVFLWQQKPPIFRKLNLLIAQTPSTTDEFTQ